MNFRDLETLVEARIASGKVELPVFPAAAQEVVSLCEAEDVDYRKLNLVIRRDATLAGNFLSLANSAAFGARVPLVSLQQALTRLGTVQTKRIALMIACKTRAFAMPGRPERAAEILGHALATGLFAQEIARTRRLNVEEAFLSGLLHDIGLPAVLQLCWEIVGRGGPPSTGTLPSAREVETCAAKLHERVGAMVGRVWSLPRAIVHVIAHHHADLATVDPVDAKAIAIVQLADALAHGVEREDEAVGHLAVHPAANVLNLYPEDIEALASKRATILELSLAA